MIMDSIIDIEVIEEYEADTRKTWRKDVEERMAEICSFYDYGFAWDDNGKIVINNGFYCNWHENYYKFFGRNIEKDNTEDGILRHYEYESAEDMVKDWLNICETTNEDYVKNGLPKPFEWIE